MDRKPTPEEEEEEEKRRKEGHIMKWRSDVSLPPIPDTNFASFLLNILPHHGGKKAVVDAATGKHHTYSDICALVPRVSAGLAGAGVAAGDTVLLLSPNHIDFPIAMLAIQLLPATCVPASTSMHAEELAHVVRVSGARWAVVEEGVVDVVEQVTALLPPTTLRQVWVIGSSSSHPSFSALMRTQQHQQHQHQQQQEAEQEFTFSSAKTVALMPFSSGTTGLPKGVMLPHRSFLTSYMQSKCLREHMGQSSTSQMVMASVLLVLPLYHIYGCNFLLMSLAAGRLLVLMAKFSFRGFLEAIQTYKITYTPIVPHIANHLAHSPLLKKYDISSLYAFGCGSAPITPSTTQALTVRTGLGVSVGYGLTETCCPISINNPATGYKEGSVGRLLPYVEMKVVGEGGGAGLPQGQHGEVWVRGPGVMLGYAPAPGAAPVPWGLQEGRWLATGDLGYCDSEGFLFLTDRMKDVIKVKGFQVSPGELEALLAEVEGVKEVAVVGVASPRFGEAPRAYVVPVEDAAPPSQQVLQEYVAARLAPHKHLVGGVEVVGALPKNGMGKVLKRQLREEFLQKVLKMPSQPSKL